MNGYRGNTSGQKKQAQWRSCKVEEGGQDVAVIGIRGLTRVEELDNAIMREVRNHYRALFGTCISVIMNVLQHMTLWDPILR